MLRREMLRTSAIVAGTAWLTDIASVTSCTAMSETKADEAKQRKIMFVGGHPDDPETGCGGTIARFADAGFEVVVVYLTRGEAGIRRKTHEEAARIRTAEAEEACRILGARPVFAGQIDGDSEVNRVRYDEFRKILESEQPDALFTHWPIDAHRDHRAASMVAYDAWLKLKSPVELYYFEVMTGEQTQMFVPTHYVDIATTEPRKQLASMAHVSQNPADFYKHHDLMNRARGMEFGCVVAEAFVRHPKSPVKHVLDELRQKQ